MSSLTQKRDALFPPCARRYLFAAVLLFGAFVAVAALRAVVFRQPGRYFASLISFTVLFAVGTYVVEDYLVRRRAAGGPAGDLDACPPGKKWAILFVVSVLGMIVSGGLLLVVLLASGVWPPARTAPADEAPPPPAATEPGAAPPEGRPDYLRGDPPPATALQGLVGYWRFDEGEGGSAADGSGNGRNGTVHAVGWQRGVRGQAVCFKGPNAWFDYGGSPAFNFAAAASFTLTGWVRTKAGQGVIVSQRNRRDPGAVVEVAVKDGRLTALVREDRGAAGQAAEVTGAAVADGVWHHFALARNAGNTVTLFCDGQLAESATGANAGGAITTDVRSAGRGPAGPPWDGCLDELAVYDRDLTAAEIRTLAGR
jgi:hypothetical protein